MKNIKIKSIKTRQKPASKTAKDFFKKGAEPLQKPFVEPYRPHRLNKIIRLFCVGFFILVIGGAGGILADRFLFPYLSHHPFFSRYQFFKKTGNETTIINQTKEIKISGEEVLPQVIKNILPKKVTVVSEIGKAPGFIFSSDGIIITERKIVLPPEESEESEEKETPFTIKTQEGETFSGELVKENSLLGLALLKIEGSNLPVINFGNSDDLEVGQRIGVVGNGITDAIISEINKVEENIEGEKKINTLIKIDRKLDENFSGSILVNFKSEAVGMILVSQKEEELTNFIIPINEIKNFLEKELPLSLDLDNHRQNHWPALGLFE
jgi:S1-C subfamily serine protease